MAFYRSGTYVHINNSLHRRQVIFPRVFNIIHKVWGQYFSSLEINPLQYVLHFYFIEPVNTRFYRNPAQQTGKPSGVIVASGEPCV